MPHRVLIVDDDTNSAQALTSLLVTNGFTVTTAATTQDAMVALNQQPADTILLDIGLPYITGDSFANILKLRHPRTRIIFVSGQYNMIDPERFGHDTLFFKKPLDPETLLEALNAPPLASSGPRHFD